MSKILRELQRESRAITLIFIGFFCASTAAGQVIPPPRAQARSEEETRVYIVTFRPGTASSDRAAVVRGAGATLRVNYNVTNAASVHASDAGVLARLRNDPRVVSVVASRPIYLAQGRGGKAAGGGGGGGGGKPAAPSGLSATAVSYNAIDLAWSDNASNETGVSIERCEGSACGNFAEVAQAGPGATSYNDVGLAASTTHRYRVRAFNGTGNSKYSNIATATTMGAPPPAPPNAPSNLTLLVVSYRQIDLQWVDNAANESGFHVQRCQGTAASCADASFLQIAQAGPNAVSYSDSGLEGGTAYTYRVRAFNGDGNSAFSSVASGTTLPAPPSSQVVPAGVQRIGAAPGQLNWTGAGVGVAIVDTGMDFSHPDLGMQPEVIGVNAFNALGGSCQDIHGHGTHVGGTVAARDNTIDVVGVAPEATLYCVNVFQPDPVYDVVATDESLIAGLEWIAANANLVTPAIRVVNMSLGRPRVPEDTPSHPLHLAVKALYDMGISVVVSAGNDPAMEVSQMVPASYTEVLAVASSTALTGVNGYDEFFTPCLGEQNILADTASYFSTDGAFAGGVGATVSAPGNTREDIFDYLGTCFVESIGILSTWPGGETIELSGTSMASPHVAGVVALMWEKELSLGLTLAPETARTRIRNSVDRIGTAPLDSAVEGYTFDGEREGVLWAPAAVGDAPPPPPDFPPVVAITGPADGSTFSAGASVSFAGAASDPEDGDLSGSLVWISDRDGQIGTGAGFSRTLSSGVHSITARVTDSGGNVASDSIVITMGSSTTPTSVQVSSILYGTAGTSLLVTVELDDEFSAPVAGASVSVNIDEWLWGSGHWEVNGTTNSQGRVQFQIVNAPWGCYITRVMSLSAGGLTWNGFTPDNWFCN